MPSLQPYCTMATLSGEQQDNHWSSWATGWCEEGQAGHHHTWHKTDQEHLPGARRCTLSAVFPVYSGPQKTALEELSNSDIRINHQLILSVMSSCMLTKDLWVKKGYLGPAGLPCETVGPMKTEETSFK